MADNSLNMNTKASDTSPPWRSRLEVSATILLIVVTLLLGGLAVWDRVVPPAPPPAVEQPLPLEALSIDDAPTRGEGDARVALIEFSDFECPYCARSARDLLPEIERQYVRTGKVLLVWRHFPLPIHEHAQTTAVAAECASRQGKFWEFHDWAFAHQEELGESSLRAAAATLRLDLAAFTTCFDGQQTAAKVKADIDMGEEFFVNATPTWFIGIIQPDGKVRVTRRLSGALPFAAFQEAIDKAIATLDASTW